MEKISVSVFVNLPKNKVWDYYTQPSHITQWNFADPSWHCPSAENNMKIGGKYLARMEAKDGSFGFDFEAYYSEIDLYKTFTYEFGGRYAKVSFEETKEGTILTVNFDPETENSLELQKNGWQAILNNFKAHAESH